MNKKEIYTQNQVKDIFILTDTFCSDLNQREYLQPFYTHYGLLNSIRNLHLTDVY
jgi:hypothetical protein